MISGGPQFSIVMPTYNRAHMVAKTIASILKNDFTDFEILVVDDGSKDDTEAVIAKFTDPRIYYYKKENGERGAARNYGAIRAKGRYINFFDSDDVMYPNHLAVAAKMIASHGEPEFFHLAYDHLHDNGKLEQVNQFNDKLSSALLFDNKLSCNGVFLRRDIALEFPFENDRILASSEDWELWIRLISRFKLHCSNEITSTVIGHDQRSLLTIAPDKVVARDLLFIEKLHHDKVVMKRYGKTFKRFIAERFTFFMMSFAEHGRRKDVLKWGFRAIRIYPLILTSKRFLASIKNIIV